MTDLEQLKRFLEYHIELTDEYILESSESVLEVERLKGQKEAYEFIKSKIEKVLAGENVVAGNPNALSDALKAIDKMVLWRVK